MITMLAETFRNLQHAGNLPTEEPIRVLWSEGARYAISPDGEGCYHYDTLAELRTEH